MFHRSSSPSPSIAPSIASTVPARPSMSSTNPSPPPAKPDPESRYDSYGLTSRRMSKGKVASEENTAPGTGSHFGTFSPGWSWGTTMASTEDNHATPSKTKKGKNVFSRVFKSGDPSSNSLVSITQSQSNDFIPLHSRSESTEILYPNVRASFDSISTVIRPKLSSRPQTPPVGYSSSSAGKTHVSPPPPSSFKKPKKLRPKSLNLPLEPPLATNNLTPEMRAELLRKNRKLQQVLGTEFSGPGSTALEDALLAASNGGTPKSPGGTNKLIKSRRPNSILKSKRSRSFSVSSPSSATSFGDFDSDEALSPWSVGPGSATSGLPFIGSSFLKVNVTSPSLSSPPFSGEIAYPKSPPLSHDAVEITENVVGPPSLSEAGHARIAAPDFNQFSPRATKREDSYSTPSVVIDPAENSNDPSESSLPEESPFHDRHTPRSIEKTSFLDLSSRPDTEDESVDPRGRKLVERKQALASSARSTSTPPLSPLYPLHFSGIGHARSLSVSTTGTVSTMAVSGLSPETPLSPEEAAALERKKKRERLVKLHRFLGSHVPAGLVLGEQNVEDGLPPIGRDSTEDVSGSGTEEGHSSTKPWGKLKGKVKGNSSASSGINEPGAQVAETQEPLEPMSEHDRAINVKRRARMEKLFGVFPPQKLYLSRTGAERPLELVIGDELAVDPMDRDDLSPGAELKSLEFLRHRHSINSLSYLVDKDDQQSLHELLSYIQGNDEDSDTEEIIFAPPEDIKDDDDFDDFLDPPYRRFRRRNIIRRHSNDYDAYSSRKATLQLSSAALSSALTPRMALLRDGISPQAGSSLTPQTRQETSISNDSPAHGFQQRRKRAAKLTKFFGTDYNSLFGEMLDSIENSVRDDQNRGSLSAEEVQELLLKLRKLKAKQNKILS